MADSRVKDLTLLASIDVTADSFLVEDDSANQTKKTTLEYIKTALGLTGTNSGDQNAFLNIAVSGQSTVTAATTTDTLTLAAGSNITITTNAGTKTVTIASTAAGVSDGDKGDITVSGSGSTWTIDAGAVSYSKIQNVANSRVLGRKSIGAGVVEELEASDILDFITTVQGSILVRTSLGWAALAPGTSGEFLRTNGAGANPSWSTPSASVSWGSITGTLALQTDLQNALDQKISSFTPPGADRIVFWDNSAAAYVALEASTGLEISGTVMTVRSASATQTGIVELATNAETQAGTDTTRAVTPAGLASVGYITASSSDILTGKSFDANGAGNSLSNVEVADFAPSAIVTASETIGANNNDTTIPTSAAVKAYADSVIGTGISDGDKGDVTVSGGGATWTIDAGAVSYSKIQNISAAARLLGRKTAGAGVTEEVTISEALDFAGSTRGQILFRGASGWTVLAPGTSGQVLQTGGSGADPSWTTPSGGSSGTVLTPSQITSWQNDYAPTGWGSGVSILRLSSDGFHFITGFGATTNGHTFQVVNIGTFPIGVYNQNTDSLPANRLGVDDHDVIILPGQSVSFWYDGTDSRFRLASSYTVNENSPFVTRYWNECMTTVGDSFGASNAMWPTAGGGTYANDTVGASFNGSRTGVVRCNTGTGATGRAGFFITANETMEYFDGTHRSYMEYRSVFYTPSSLSDAVNDYLVFAGYLNSDTGNPADGAHFRYNHASSSGNFERVTASSTVRTTADTGIAFATATWYVFRVVLYPNGTSEFYINGVSAGRNTTDLPSTNRNFSFGAYIRKTAGSLAREVAIDGIGILHIKATK